jgi:hypothetical protein
MLLKFLSVVQVILFLISSNASAQKLEVIEGKVAFTFTRDSLLDEPMYWLAKKEFGGQFFIEDIADVIGVIDLACGAINVKVPEERRTFYELPEFKSQDKQNDGFYSHYGGDVFSNHRGQIVITFFMKAMVVKFDKPPCEKVSFQSFYSCPVERERVEYPVYLVVDVLEAKSSDEESLKQEKLVPYDKKSFLKGECD